MKNIFANLNIFERVLLVFSIVVYTVCAIISNSLDGWIAWLSCVTYAVYLIFNANAKYFSFVWLIISYLIYLYFNVKEFYFGEFALSIFAIVINFIAMLNWKKNTHNNQLKLNQLSAKEVLLSIGIMLVGGIGVFFILRLLNTTNVILNTLSVSVTLLEYYFTFRRTILKYFVGFFTLIVYILLWAFVVESVYDYSFMFVVNGIISIAWYIDSIVQWRKMLKLKLVS